MAVIEASSARATTRGEASTSTSPERNAHAVSSSVTCMLTVAVSPGRGAMGAKPIGTPATRGNLRGPSGRYRKAGITEGVIAADVVERTLTTALARGGDFAEVFAEDRQSVSARLDDG